MQPQAGSPSKNPTNDIDNYSIFDFGDVDISSFQIDADSII